MKEKRIVITGMGVISPVGLDVPTAWQNLIAGRSGIGPITLFDASELNVRIAGEAHGFEPTNYMDAKDARRADRFTQFAIAALAEALDQSGLTINEHNVYDVGSEPGRGLGLRHRCRCHRPGFRNDPPGSCPGHVCRRL
jgi:3-oxoacyl-[acyl-carrier-protein] synthase II